MVLSIETPAINPSEQQTRRLHREFEELINRSPNISVLIDALDALEWQGDPKTLADVLPHFTDRFDLIDLRNALA